MSSLLTFDMSRVEADPASVIGKKVYFFSSYAYALAALDDSSITAGTDGIKTLEGYDRLSNAVTTDTDEDPYTDLTDNLYTEVDENCMVCVSFASAADMYMIVPNSGHGIQPVFIPAEMLVAL